MNARSYKTVFSKHVGALVAVGEHASSQGKANGAGSGGGAGASGTLGYIAALTASFALVSLAWAAPATNALPTAGQVVLGAASMSQAANQLTINQSTQRAAINWQSFDIGAQAKVQVVQPNAQAVLLNRVVGQSPSQIFGQLNANGHVILVNPNGVLFGKDGSVNAASFTASTLGISDANFMAGNMVYERNGSTAGVVNQGTIKATGGYVALLGASVSNEGKIETHGGTAYLAAAETVKIPVSGSGRIKLELSPASINAAVSNSKDGTIVTQGGQVYMQALALNRAAAQVIQSGSIDTSGEQAGAVHLLADGGTIKVDGSITANSSGTDDKGQQRKGGDIVIGRDVETGVLAKLADVSGVKLESQRGFVETSGDVLVTTGTRVKAGEWLLDPYNIIIAASGASGTAYGSSFTSGADSVILASDISVNLTAGTSVTLATGAGSNSAGNIDVNESIAKTGGGDATLTLLAHGGITVAAGKTITSNTGKLNVVLNSDADGTNGGGITFNTGSGITSNGGNITLGGGTALNGSGFASGDAVSTLQGISLQSAAFAAGGGNIVMNGQSPASSATNASNIAGVLMSSSTISTSGAGTIAITGNNRIGNSSTGNGLVMNGGTITGGSTGTVTLVGDSSASSTGFSYVKGAIINGTVTSAGGNINITGMGGTGVLNNYGVDIVGSVMAVGSGEINITGTASQTSNGSENRGVSTSGGGTISSVNGNINITGVGGKGFVDKMRHHGVFIDGTNAIRSTGIGNITVKGTASQIDNNFTKGVVINRGGMTTTTGNIKVDGSVPAGYQGAVWVNASVNTTSGGNIYIRSEGANITTTSTGTLFANNISIDNSNGSIDATSGVITPSTAGASFATGVGSRGIEINGSITAVNNLNIYGNHASSYTGVGILGAITIVKGKSIKIDGLSNTGNGVLLSGATLSGETINATGTTGGANGFAMQGGTIEAIGTNKTISTIKGISNATGNTNGYGALQVYNGTNIVKAASDNKLVLEGKAEAPANTAPSNTYERGILVQGGISLSTSGDVTLKGTSNNSDGVSLGGSISELSVNGVTNKLTINGTTNAIKGTVKGVNLSGSIANTSINIEGSSGAGEGVYSNAAIATSGDIKLEGISAEGAGVVLVSNNAVTPAINATNGDVFIKGESKALTNGQQGVRLGDSTSVLGKNVKVEGSSLNGNGVISYAAINANEGNATITGTSTGTGAYASALSLHGPISASSNVFITGSNTNNNNGEAAVHIRNSITANGNINVTASTKGTSANALQLYDGANLTAKTEINLKADTLSISTAATPATINAGAGKVTITTVSADAKINIGAADVGVMTPGIRTLGLTKAELDRITAGKTVIGDAANPGGITVSAATTTKSETGDITLHTAGNIDVNAALTVGDVDATKNLTLNGVGSTSTIKQTAAIKAAGLELLGANATHTLTNAGNQVATLAANTKAVDYFNSGALTLGSVNTDGINASGDVSIATETGNLTIAKNVATTATSATALKLNAAKSAGVGAAVGSDYSGNIIVSGASVSVGAGGTAQLMTGSITGNTTAAALASAGNFRYNSDKTNTNYSKALTSKSGTNNGINVIYREKPVLTVAVNDQVKDFDGIPFSGGSVSIKTGQLFNGDSQANAFSFGGNSQGAVLAGSYTINGVDVTPSALGYGLTYAGVGALTIKKTSSVNPINPPPSPANNNTGSRVSTVSGFGGSGAATGVLDDKPVTESREVCSDVFPENCECQPSVIPTIEICFAPKRVAATKEEK